MDYKDLTVYVSTCNGYDVLLKPFYHLFNKFWDTEQKVTILGYRTPPFELPDNFNFVSMGERQVSASHWSTDLRNFFNSIDDEYFIYTVEDSFLLNPIDRKIMQSLADCVSTSTGRIALNGHYTNKPRNHWNVIRDEGYYKIGEFSQIGEYRVSALWSIWSKKYMLKYLQPNRTPWEAELIGSREAKNDGYSVIGPLDDVAIQHALGRRVRQGGPEKTHEIPLDFRWCDYPNRKLSDDDILGMVKNNIINKDLTVKL